MSKQARGTYQQSQQKQAAGEYTTVHGDIIHASEKAILFVSSEDQECEVWIPRSQIRNGSPEELGTEEDVDLDVATWFVQKEDIR